MATIPSITVTFIQKAGSLIARSERGIATLIIRDETDTGFDIKKYTSAAELTKDKLLFTDDNYKQIEDMLSFAPYISYIIRIDNEGTLSDALSILEKNVKTGWVGVANGTADDQTALVSWIKAKEQRQVYYKAICYKANSPDNKQIVNFYNDKVTFVDERGEKTGDYYVASLIGLLASLNIKSSATNKLCHNLKYVEEIEDSVAAVKSGKFILFNADTDSVRIVSGCNSLTTTNGSTLTEDMMYIETVEAMNMIADDIRNTFKDTYLGNYKNNLDNQMLFIAGVNAYFKQLSAIGVDVLDREFTNICYIDTESQKDAWLGVGKSEAEDWDESKIMKMTFKRSVFLKSDIKILGSMENLAFIISMV